MVLAVARNEFRYQLLSPTGIVTFSILFGFAFLLTANAAEFETYLAGGLILANAPWAITELVIKLSVFAAFAVPPFIAGAILRDVDHGFDGILFATPLTRRAYLAGRFAGAFSALMVALAGALIGLLLGSFWPWAPAELLGPNRPAYYLHAYFVVLLPSMLSISAIVFATASLTRSNLQTYLAVLALLALYLVLGETDILPTILDPFLYEVFDAQTRYWTAAERNVRLLDLDGPVLASRVLWLAIAAALLWFAGRRFSFRTEARRPGRAATEAPSSGGIPATVVTFTGAGSESDGAFLVANSARWDLASRLRQLAHQTGFEVMHVLRSTAFLVLLAICFCLLALDLTSRELLYGVQALPVTRLMLPDTAPIRITLLAVIAFYSADIVWRERACGIAPVVDAMPASDRVLVTAKFAALGLIVTSVLVLGIVLAALLQLLTGDTPIEWGLLLHRGLLYPLLPYLCLAVLALACQVLAGSRYLGMLLFGLFIAAVVVSRDVLGIEHPLASYVFPGVSAPLSDMNGSGRFLALPYAVRAWWLSIAGVLIVLTYLLYPRGTAQPLFLRLRRLRVLRSRRHALPAGVLAAALIGTGSFIYYNTNVLNDYHTTAEIEALRVGYEKTWRPAAAALMPRITAIDLAVDLFPGEPALTVRGVMTLENRAGGPISSVLAVFPPGLELEAVTLDGAEPSRSDRSLVPVLVFDLAEPLAPGATARLRFAGSTVHRGFPHRGPDTRLVGNGTFLTQSRLVPTIGFEDDYVIEDRRTREKHGLSRLPRRAPVDDPRQRYNNAASQDSDFLAFEATVSTPGDQIALAPGTLLRSWSEDDRRYFRYRMDTPIRKFFAVFSGRYAVVRDRWEHIPIEIYHHPPHTRNLDRLLAAAKDSLQAYSEAYGPYPFAELRIVEVPAFREFTAQAFAGTIALTEDRGFLADVAPGDIDMPYYVMAHEVAHQWWGHVVAGANVEGAGFVNETLAQYSALRVMAAHFGEDRIRRFLKYELDRYLAGRGEDPEGERPLIDVARQSYIHYRKGSMVMYALADYLGASVVDRSLRRMVATRGFNSDPYATSRDFLAILKEESDPSHHPMIEDFLERITLYDLALEGAWTRARADGRYEVRLALEAGKRYADAMGTETAAPLTLPVEIGLFARSPADPEFGPGDVLYLEKQVLADGASELTLVVDRMPSHAGIDPYHKLIDRDSGDNLKTVQQDDSSGP